MMPRLITRILLQIEAAFEALGAEPMTGIITASSLISQLRRIGEPMSEAELAKCIEVCRISSRVPMCLCFPPIKNAARPCHVHLLCHALAIRRTRCAASNHLIYFVPPPPLPLPSVSFSRCACTPSPPPLGSHRCQAVWQGGLYCCVVC